MCGIAGQFNYRTGAPVDERVLQGMAALLAHRGPDGSGVFVAGNCGLAHRRLAIIDLSDAGRQPMSWADGRYQIIFNGEIYNFQELRSGLQAEGCRFKTRTDTEVLVAAYAAYGAGCLDRLQGMFAFGIWDAQARSLFLARDRAGKKPLHYWEHADGISFASEPKAFLADASFPREVNVDAISAYLALQYVPAPLSAFKGVRKLPPGHYAIIDANGVRLTRYWRLRYSPKLNISEADAVATLRTKLKAAVERRLISDVPLGAFLSGGIDSSLIVALMSELNGKVKTFSIGFDEQEYNELAFARKVAERYATEHHEFIVRPNAIEVLPDLIWHYNEPYADSSAIPTYYLSRMTRQHVTVALNGDAGDENFAGYERYVANVMADRLDRLPSPAKRVVQRMAAMLPASRSRTLTGRVRRFATALGQSSHERYLRWLCHFDADRTRELCTPEFHSRFSADPFAPLLRTFQQTDAPDLIDATLDVDVNHYLPDDLLVKVDIATMAHSLEARSPLIDHDVMEFAARLPSTFKLHGRTKKYLLKRLAREYLPDEIIDRPKMGFGVPLEPWFRKDLREFAHDVLQSNRARERGYFRAETVERLLREHATGARAWHYLLWNLLVLELWHREFIDSVPAPRRSPASAVSVG